MTCAASVSVRTGYVTHHVTCPLVVGHDGDHRPPVGLPVHDCQRNGCPPPPAATAPHVAPAPNSMTLRLDRMTAEQEAEMAEWEQILRGKPLRR